MILRTLWVWRQDVDYPECVLAWDQGLIDEIPDVWDVVRQTAIDQFALVEDPHVKVREIAIQLSEDAVMKHWCTDPIDGEVKSP